MSVRVVIGPSSFAQSNPRPLQLLRDAGADVVPNPHARRLTAEEIAGVLADADGLIAGLEPLTREVLARAPRLRAIARVGVGMDNVDREAAEEMGIRVSNTPDGPTEAVAEMTVAAALALGRRLTEMNRDLHDRRWRKVMGTGLVGQYVLIVGYGRIGRRTAELLRPFGCEIRVVDPALAEDPAEEGVSRVSLEQGLREADIVTFHADAPECILGRAEFALMKRGVMLLNSARGHLVDGQALAEALDAGTVSGAWIDAFVEEPYEGVLSGYEQVLLTPHVSSYTRQCRLAMETAAVRNLLGDLGVAGG